MTNSYKTNIETVRGEIGEAAVRSGRTADDVTLVAVTKYLDASETRRIVEAGCSVLGESRPQVLWEKASELADLDVKWHMIGHLQRNKVKKTLPFCSLIHSVDSQRLMKSINDHASELSEQANILLEINVSGEAAKHGLPPNELEAVLEFGATLPSIKISGLMCMAGLNSTPDETTKEFATLRELRESHASFRTDNIELKELSMGMSNDFAAAIEQGATIVRVGSRLIS